jgi:hypothetical protein
MDRPALLDALIAMTRSWTLAPGVQPSDLISARSALAGALAAGFEPDDLVATRPSRPAFATATAAQRSEIERLVPHASDGGTPELRPFVRSSSDLDPASGAAIVGMQISRTLGPFIDDLGIEHLVDLIPIPRKIPIEGASGALGLLVLDAPPHPAPLPLPAPQKVPIGAGGLWVAVHAVLGGTSSGFVGLAFSKGTAELANVQTAPDGGLKLGTNSKLVLELTLAAPAPVAGSSPIGRDAEQMTVALPTQVTVEFVATGAAFTAIADVSATVYGTGFSIGRSAAAPHAANFGLSYLLFPGAASISDFNIASCLSADFVLSGSAPVQAAGWALPITTAPPAGFGNPAGAGVLLLQLHAGLAARFGDRVAPTPLSMAALILVPSSITVFTETGKRAFRERMLLWDPPPASALQAVPEPIRRVSEIDLTIAPGAMVYAVITPGSESVIIGCSSIANLDRPLAVDGARLPLAYTAGFIGYFDSSTGKRVVLLGFTPPQGERGRVIALENALIATRPSSALLFAGQRTGGPYAGVLVLAFPLGGIVPMLPDPYAASFTTPQLIDTGTSGSLIARLAWTPNAVPPLVLSILGTPIPLPGLGVFTLLDVSTNADQFGVSVFGREVLAGGQTALNIELQALAASDTAIAVYALPGISWEPVVSDQPPAPVDWWDAFSPDDGPATTLRATTIDLVRIEPRVALPHFREAAGKVATTASFTLPFGLMAQVVADPQRAPDALPTYELIKANFASGLDTGLQLAIIAGAQSAVGTRALPGNTTTGSTINPPVNAGSYGDLVLGNLTQLDAAQFFNRQFQAGQPTAEVPVNRIDLSGYGTSMFSDWAVDDTGFVGVVRSRFDVLVGRTAYELVQIQTLIVPWCIRITRTIIFDRADTGLVLRHDTGWKAVGNGTFAQLQPGEVLPGAVLGLSNVHNIQIGTGARIQFISPDQPDYSVPKPSVPPATGRQAIFAPVFFDADVLMDGNLVGTVSNGRIVTEIAGSNIAGWAQLSIGYAASAAEILTLMGMLGPMGVGGKIGALVSVGKHDPVAPQFTLNVSSLSAVATSTTTTEHGHTYPAAVGVALHGTPLLPRDGSWSIARRPSGGQAPTAVDPSTPIPLVRGKGAAGDQWRLIDPVDALAADAPATFYGVLQGTGTSKTLFEHPIIDDLGKALRLDTNHPPNLADVGALLGATDIFPNLGSVLGLDSQLNPLALAQDGFKQTYEQDIDQPDRTIFDLGVIRILLSYSAPDGHGGTKKTHVKFVLDPAASPRWSLDITGISFKAQVDGFGSDPLLTIYGDFSGSETSKPGVKNIQVEYGSALSFVKDIFSGLGEIIKSLGGDVDLDVGFSGNRLFVRDFLAVPTIPLGFGDIRDITLDLGFEADIPSDAAFHVGLGSKDKPFTWLVSPLSGTGALVLGVEKGDLDVYVEAGIGAGLEINLAVASGSASITLELALNVSGGTIAVAVTLLGQAEVDVLGGLASASLTLAASVILTPHPLAFPPNDIELAAAVAVGIHISICWVVSIDFDGSWQFSQDVPVHL